MLLTIAASCPDDDIACAIRQLSASLDHNTWIDALPTFIATVLGALLGAWFAWLFARQAARERQAERDRDYADLMRQQWPSLVKAFRDLANAERQRLERPNPRVTHDDITQQYRDAVVALTDQLYRVASMSRGPEYIIINQLGLVSSTYVPMSQEGVSALSEVAKSLAEYVAKNPDDLVRARQVLLSSLSRARQLGESGIPG